MPRWRRFGSEESLTAWSSRSTPSCSNTVPLTNPVATRSATRPSINALVSSTCRSPLPATDALGFMPTSPKMSSYFASPRRKPSDPHTRYTNTIAGHAAASGTNNSGTMSKAATTRLMMNPTTPPASCGAGLRRSSCSRPLTARRVRRPATPPITKPTAAPRKMQSKARLVLSLAKVPPARNPPVPNRAMKMSRTPSTTRPRTAPLRFDSGSRSDTRSPLPSHPTADPAAGRPNEPYAVVIGAQAGCL